MSLLNPRAPMVENPKGLTKVIQPLQEALMLQLPWLTVSYGIASTGGTLDGKVAQVPEVFDGENYLVLTPNNQVAAHSFFKQETPIRYDNYVAYQRNGVKVSMSLIVLCNLDTMREYFETTFIGTFNHRYTDEVRAELLKVIKQEPGFVLRQISETPREVFEGYTYAQTEPQAFRHPYAGYKFLFDIGFQEDC
jgi:hypothetical protein